MNQESYIKNYEIYMRLEKSFSPNSIEAYSRDLNILIQFLKEKDKNFQMEKVSHEDLKEFLHW
ncbi:MAG: site-specific integrase, partial [Bacteroidales bacterium]